MKNVLKRKPLGAPERNRLSLQLPAADGKPLLEFELEVSSMPRAGGEDTHVRMHLRSSLGNVNNEMPATRSEALPGTNRPGYGILPVRQAASLVQRGLKNELVQRFAAPLLKHDLDTWIDVRASTAPLLRGVAALMPPAQAEKLSQLGVTLPTGNVNMARTWAGATTGARPGFAQFSVLRFDKRHLPPRVSALLGSKPFQAVASIAQVVESRDDTGSE